DVPGGDPLLHTHLVVANRTQGPDGRWTAVDGRDLYRHRLAADAMYRATYQRELARTLGVEWTPADPYELDLPRPEQPHGYLQLAQALSRASGQRLAIDTPHSLDLQRLSTAGLRAERDRLRR